MTDKISISDEEVLKYRKILDEVIKQGRYYFNPDDQFTNSLIKSLLINRERYGYESCPCRLAQNDRQKDLDIICPCYYRDDDVSDYGTCYCGLYVSREFYENKTPISPIPERRLKPKPKTGIISMKNIEISRPIWRCNVCGYLCSRDTAPDECPICKASKDRFEILIKAE